MDCYRILNLSLARISLEQPFDSEQFLEIAMALGYITTSRTDTENFVPIQR